MNTDERGLIFGDLTESVLGAAFEVSNTLGAGFLEKVYERALARELAVRALRVRTQVPFPIFYKTVRVGDYYADMVVDGKLVVEVKCVERLIDEHVGQCLNYLRASGLRMALLVNFGRSRVEWQRVVG